MSVNKRGNSYEVRWRVGNKQYSKCGFPTKRSAQAFEAEQLQRIKSHTFTAPREAKITMNDLAQEWFVTKDVSDRTMLGYQEVWKNLIAPTWSSVKLENVKPDGVVKWVTTLNRGHSAARVRKAFTVFKQILDLAVMGERLTTNPADRAKQVTGKGLLPRIVKEERDFRLSNEQVLELAEAAGPYRVMFLVMAYTGVRFGEASALQAGDVDLITSRLHVRRAYSDVAGKLQVVTPKSGKPRTIPIPAYLHAPLMEVLFSCESSDSLLFTAQKGGPIRYGRWRKSFFDVASQSVGLKGLTPHDLKRAYATLSMQAGVGPKALQAAMGHSDIRLTMDTYAGVFELDKDDHAARLSAAAEKAFEVKCSQNVRTSTENKQKLWSRLGDLNPGPTHYECVALPLS
jgi:integrase